jgi:hypothetical protein
LIAAAEERRDRSVDVARRRRQSHWPQQVFEQPRKVLGDRVVPLDGGLGARGAPVFAAHGEPAD